jgi:hypothetical protein
MLTTLLTEIQRGGTVQPVMLASKLNISLGLVQAMLENLERMGMLTQIIARCSEPCGGCPMVDGCSTHKQDQGRVWMLTAKAKANSVLTD